MSYSRGEQLQDGKAWLRPPALLLICLASLVTPCAAEPAAGDRLPDLCVASPGEIVTLTSEGLRAEPPIEGLDTNGEGAPAALACTDSILVVALPSARGSGLRVFGREGAGWVERPALRRTLRFLPLRLVLFGQTLIAVRERRNGFELHGLPLEGEGRVEVRPLPSEPSVLLSGPAEEQLLVAAGESLRSYLLPRLFSREVIPFGEPLVAAVRPEGSSRIALSSGRRVFEIDLADQRRKGRLPVRAEVTLSSAVARLFWVAEQEAVAAVVRDPAQVIFLSPVSLTPIRTLDLPEPPLAAGIQGRTLLLALSGGRLERVEFPELAVVTAAPKTPHARKAAAVAPHAPPEGDPGATAPSHHVPAPEPSPARPGAAAPPASSVLPAEEAAASPPAPPASSPAPPAAAAPPVSSAPPVEEAAAAPPAPPASSPAPPAAAAPPASSVLPVEEAAASPAAPPASSPAPPAAAAPPADGDGGTTASPPTGPALEPSDSKRPYPSAPAVPRSPASPEAPPAAVPAPPQPPVPDLPSGPGVLAGRIAGRAELVAEIVILGPDNLLAERARIKPLRQGEALVFIAKGLPPGSYRIVPMGPDGASLRSQPAFAAVRISESGGAEVSFKIAGNW